MPSERYPHPTQSDLRQLAELEAPVVSLFVPVTAAVPDVAQNPVRHRRSVEQALARLRSLGVEKADVGALETALAHFAADESAPAPSVATRVAIGSGGRALLYGLPFEHEESLRVASAAALRPLARVAREPGRYRVLALSVKRVELYAGDVSGLSRVANTQLPKSLEDALGRDLTEPALQFHSTASHGGAPVYHGHGGAPRGRDVDLERFHQHLARALESETQAAPPPLVLAADATHYAGLSAALRRDVGLLPDALEGNPDHRSARELHEAAWPLLLASRPAARGLLERERESGAAFVSEASELAAKAVSGRIRRLWVPELGGIPGRLDRATTRIADPFGDDDLVESLAAETLRRGGEVLVLEGERYDAKAENLIAELR